MHLLQMQQVMFHRLHQLLLAPPPSKALAKVLRRPALILHGWTPLPPWSRGPTPPSTLLPLPPFSRVTFHRRIQLQHRWLGRWAKRQSYLAQTSFGSSTLSRWSGHRCMRLCASSSGRPESAEHQRFRPGLQRQDRLRLIWSVAGTSGRLQPAAAMTTPRAPTVAANLGCSDQSNLNSVHLEQNPVFFSAGIRPSSLVPCFDRSTLQCHLMQLVQRGPLVC